MRKRTLENVLQAGAHRGGGEIARAFEGEIGEVHVVDPNRAHAEEVAAIHSARGRRTRIDARRIEDVIDAIDPEAAIALAPDSLPAVKSVIGRRELRLGHIEAQGLLQGTARSSQDLPLGAQWSLPPGRDDLRAEAFAFLRVLEELAPPASGASMRTTFLAERRLDRQRERLSRLTATHLMEREAVVDREYAGELFLDIEAYPLVLVAGRPRLPELHEAASDLTHGRHTAVAFMDTTGMDLVFLDAVDGHTRVTAHFPLDRPRPVVPRREMPVPSSATRPVRNAGFTD